MFKSEMAWKEVQEVLQENQTSIIGRNPISIGKIGLIVLTTVWHITDGARE